MVMLACAAGCTCGGRRDASRDARATTVETAVADANVASTVQVDASTATPDVLLVLASVCDDAEVPVALSVSISVPLNGRPAFRIADDVMGFAGTADLISNAVAEDRSGPLH